MSTAEVARRGAARDGGIDKTHRLFSTPDSPVLPKVDDWPSSLLPFSLQQSHITLPPGIQQKKQPKMPVDPYTSNPGVLARYMELELPGDVIQAEYVWIDGDGGLRCKTTVGPRLLLVLFILGGRLVCPGCRVGRFASDRCGAR